MAYLRGPERIHRAGVVYFLHSGCLNFFYFSYIFLVSGTGAWIGLLSLLSMAIEFLQLISVRIHNPCSAAKKRGSSPAKKLIRKTHFPTPPPPTMPRTASLTRAPRPVLSSTQAVASRALAALLARRRGLKPPTERRLKRKPKPAAKNVGGEKGKDVIERNVRALKKSGKVGDGEKEVRRRVGFWAVFLLFLGVCR